MKNSYDITFYVMNVTKTKRKYLNIFYSNNQYEMRYTIQINEYIYMCIIPNETRANILIKNPEQLNHIKVV